MQNINIKAIFVEKELSNEKIQDALRSDGAIVIVVDCENLNDVIQNIRVPLFNQCAVGKSEQFLSKAKELGIRCVRTDEKTFSEMCTKTFLECGRFKPYYVDEYSFIETPISR